MFFPIIYSQLDIYFGERITTYMLLMWHNLSLDGINFRPGYLHKLGVYKESVKVPF